LWSQSSPSRAATPTGRIRPLVTQPPESESHGRAPGAGISTFMAQMAKGLSAFQT
jgi:hypothetical protein